MKGKLFWAAVWFIAGASARLFIDLAWSAEPTLTDRVAAVQATLRSKSEEPVDARAMAESLVDATGGNRRLIALALSMAVHESALADRIRRGEYKQWEGDAFRGKDGVVHHRAWGVFQVHRNASNLEVWGSDDLLEQTRAAVRLLRGAQRTCGDVAFPLGAFRAVAGCGCAGHLSGEEKRVATFKYILSKI